jgi:hypothetical protein
MLTRSSTTCEQAVTELENIVARERSFMKTRMKVYAVPVTY